MNTRTQQVLLHLAGVMLVLSLPLLFSPESLTLRAYLMNPPTQRDFIFYALLLASFYLNYYGLIPKFYFTRRYPLLLLINTGCFIVINLLPGYLIRPRSPAPFLPVTPGSSQFSVPRHPGPPPPFSMDITQHLFVYLVVLFLALLLKIRERLKQTEKEKLQTELSYLKAQINPHFLFNVLNGIYSLTIEKSDKAPDAVIKLSEMMRYVLDESGNELVTLEQELKYIRNYIALQGSRFGPGIRLHYHIDEPPRLAEPSSLVADGLQLAASQKIAPLILIPFIENAFKHGVNPEEDSDIYIGITISGDELRLEVVNKKVHIHHAEKHSGLGIANAKKRLQLLYPGEHTLRIEDNKEDFRVFVTLKLET